MHLSLSRLIRYLLIGVAIGSVDLVPGVSGGTLAFVFGLWERLLESLAILTSAFRKVIILRFSEAKEELARLDWLLIVPLGFGVLAALFLGASLIGTLLDSNKELVKSFFFGLVVGALPLPFRRIERWNMLCISLFILGFAASFLLSGLSPQEALEPPWYFVFIGASVSICATILPGLSGSFVLLLLGLYEPFIDAIRDRNLFFVGMFVLGSWFGLTLFVGRVRWLLYNHRDSVLSILLGMMLGGLRVLWPWQTGSGELFQLADFNSLLTGLFCMFFGLMAALVINKFTTSVQ